MREVGNVYGSAAPAKRRRTGAADGGPATLASGDPFSALSAISGVAEALTAAGTLEELAATAVARMRRSLGLAIAALHLADGVPRAPASPSARGMIAFAADADPRNTLKLGTHLVLDRDAWSLLAAARGPLLFGAASDGMVANPFQPPAASWLVLPLQAEGEIVGVVVAADDRPIVLDAASVMLLSALGNILSAGIAMARTRLALQHAAVERERTRLAADLHDGLAQDLALAKREIARLDGMTVGRLPDDSWQRLRECVDDANRSIRTNLEDLCDMVPAGGLGRALAEVRSRFAAAGPAVSVDVDEPWLEPPAEVVPNVVAIVREALTNIQRHAGSSQAHVRVSAAEAALRVEIIDAGVGLPAGHPGPGERHYGISIMRKRARSVGGSVDVAAVPGGGTKVTLSIPLERRTLELP